MKKTNPCYIVEKTHTFHFGIPQTYIPKIQQNQTEVWSVWKDRSLFPHLTIRSVPLLQELQADQGYPHLGHPEVQEVQGNQEVHQLPALLLTQEHLSARQNLDQKTES